MRLADPFAFTFGAGRGLPPSSPLLSAGHGADRELARLCALIDAGDEREPLAALAACSAELAPEVPWARAEPLTDAQFWTAYQQAWNAALRMAGGGANRVERLFCHRLRHGGLGQLPASPHVRAVTQALERFEAVPRLMAAFEAPERLRVGAFACSVHLHLSRLLVDGGSYELVGQPGCALHESGAADAFDAQMADDAFGALMADWTMRAGWREVLPRALGDTRFKELYAWLDGVNGRRVDSWLSPTAMPFTNWQAAYSSCLYFARADPAGGAPSDWVAAARDDLSVWLHDLPDAACG